jgi:hypothetical protein
MWTLLVSICSRVTDLRLKLEILQNDYVHVHEFENNRQHELSALLLERQGDNTRRTTQSVYYLATAE